MMDYSYDYNRTADLSQEETRSRAASRGERTLLSRAALQSLSGAILLAVLLFLSVSADGLFMNELISVSVVWVLISLVRLQGEPNSTWREKP